jgi:hypothetical protein
MIQIFHGTVSMWNTMTSGFMFQAQECDAQQWGSLLGRSQIWQWNLKNNEKFTFMALHHNSRYMFLMLQHASKPLV